MYRSIVAKISEIGREMTELLTFKVYHIFVTVANFCIRNVYPSIEYWKHRRSATSKLNFGLLTILRNDNISTKQAVNTC